MTVKVTKDKTGEIEKAIKALVKRKVLIGIPDSAAERKPEPGGSSAPSNSTIGYVMEFGEPSLNIPARPFLVPGVVAAKEKIVARMRKTGEAVLSGDLDALDPGLMAAGLIGQSAVKAKITQGPFEPLAERTLAARRARGRTGEKPLVDTGQLRQAVTYVIREK